MIGASRRCGIEERNRSFFSRSHNQLLILELEGYRRNILIIAHSTGGCVPVLHLQVLGERNYTAGVHSAGFIGSSASGDKKGLAIGREHRPGKCEGTRTRRCKAGHVVIGRSHVE